MKTARIIGIIICILIPLAITGFIVNYVYNDPDDIMNNKTYKWDEYLEKNFGNTMVEKFKSYLQIISDYYDTEPVVNYVDTNNRFKVVVFRHVNVNSNTVTYTGFLYAIDFTQIDLFEVKNETVTLKDNNLKIVYANENIDLSTLDEDDSDRLTLSFSTFAYKTLNVKDNEATIPQKVLDVDEDYEVAAYRFQFTQVSEVGDDNTITFRIDLNNGDEYKETLFGTEAGYKLTNIVKSARRFESMMADQGSTITTGLSGDTLKFGKGYTAFILPTVIWISLVALVISGGLSYLFYIIWTAEEDNKPSLPKPTKAKKGS